MTPEKKLGRNDPCWCGSGKKYKHCHRREDLEKEREMKKEPVFKPASPSLSEPPPRSPEQEAAWARWKQFEAADIEGKIALFRETLSSGQMDTEGAYEMSQAIRDATDPRGNPDDRALYAGLIEQLRREAPDLYRHDVVYYTANLLDDAIADGQWEAIPELVAGFAESDKPGQGIDIFLNVVVEQLMYHGQAPALMDTMSRMWPQVSVSSEITSWGIEEFAHVLMQLILLDYLETAESPRADDPALREALAPYGKFKPEWLERAVRHISAPAPSAWQPADFGEAVDADQWADNLDGLLFEFMADQRRRAGVPLTKSDLVRAQLTECLHRQFAEPVEGSGKRRPAKRRPGKKRGRKEHLPLLPRSSLVPRRAILDPSLAELFGFLSARPYKAGVVTELLPAYLHFLARLGLIHPTEMDSALRELLPLGNDMRRALDNYGADPRLVRAVADAWSDSALAALRDDPALAEARATPPVVPAPPPKPARRPGAVQTYTFKVTYLRDPNVWRTIEIAENQTLDDLHYAILGSVDFDSDHLYSFFMSGKAWDRATEYASPYGEERRSAARVKIGDLRLRMKQRFLYLFDYGDEHRFEVQLVATNPDAPKGDYPKVVKKHGQAPPQYPDW